MQLKLVLVQTTEKHFPVLLKSAITVTICSPYTDASLHYVHVPVLQTYQKQRDRVGLEQYFHKLKPQSREWFVAGGALKDQVTHHSCYCLQLSTDLTSVL